MARKRHPRSSGGLYLESTRELGVLPGEDRPVREVMDRRITLIDPSYPLREAIQSMRKEQTTALLVQDHTELYGILTEHGGVAGLLSLVDVAASVMPGTVIALLHEVRKSH